MKYTAAAVALGAVFLAGCATQYQKNGATGGFQKRNWRKTFGESRSRGTDTPGANAQKTSLFCERRT